MRSIVTGGAGFIGSHLVDALIGRGDDVLVIDDLSAGSHANLDASPGGFDLEVSDIADAGANAAIVGFAPDCVYHLAAQIDVRKAVAEPVTDARVNVLGTIAVLEAARAAGASFVFASTGGAIYGEGAGLELPLPETAAVRPEAPYGVSKLAGENYLELYRRLHGLAGVALRFGNVYGPRQDPHGEAGVVAIFGRMLLSGKPPIIFGDGRQTRDYVYVADVVAAMALCGARLAEVGTAVSGPLNIGTGTETSVLELAEEMGAAAGRKDLVPQHAPARAGEVERNALDAAHASNELGWRPQTALADGLALTLESIKARLAVP